MAYFPRKQGLDSYRLAKTRKDCKCFVCGESIAKGTLRYASGRYLSLCMKCADCWGKEGGRLGEISRAKEDINLF